MRDVEQVLDQQQIIGRDLHRADHDAFPAVVGHLGQPRRLPHLGERGIARPDPDQAVLFLDREADHLGLRRNRAGGMRGNHHTLAGRVVAQAMVGAFECAVRHQSSLRQREALVRAAVVEGRDVTILGAPDDDGALGDHVTAEGLLREVLGKSGNVPAVANNRMWAHGVSPRDFAAVWFGTAPSSRTSTEGKAEGRRLLWVVIGRAPAWGFWPARSRSSRSACVHPPPAPYRGVPARRRDNA